MVPYMTTCHQHYSSSPTAPPANYNTCNNFTTRTNHHPNQPPNIHPTQPARAMDEPAPKRKRETTAATSLMAPSSMPSASSEADEFYRLARGIQHRSGLSKASFATEDRRFREYFGVSVIVALSAWRLLVKHDLLPDETEVGVASREHMLWAMYFLKCYPRTGEGCGAAGGSTRKNSAVDPKTWRKYIWPMIYSLSDLESIVVSHFTGHINPI